LIGDDDKPVVVLVTSLVSGQTLASCADDLPLLLIGQLATTLAVDPQRLYDAIQRFTDREAKSAAKAAAAAASEGSGAADDDDPPERSDDVHGDAADDQGGLTETARLGQESE
jgi:hypothetical protein